MLKVDRRGRVGNLLFKFFFSELIYFIRKLLRNSLFLLEVMRLVCFSLFLGDRFLRNLVIGIFVWIILLRLLIYF